MVEKKEHGEHRYLDHGGASGCIYGCGCYVDHELSDGPLGLDPHGKCPNNPKDGKLLGGTKDYEYVVNERIENLESRLKEAGEIAKKIKSYIPKIQDVYSLIYLTDKIKDINK